jgi:uncharacterized protein YidB (DUF937 family)
MSLPSPPSTESRNKENACFPPHSPLPCSSPPVPRFRRHVEFSKDFLSSAVSTPKHRNRFHPYSRPKPLSDATNSRQVAGILKSTGSIVYLADDVTDGTRCNNHGSQLSLPELSAIHPRLNPQSSLVESKKMPGDDLETHIVSALGVLEDSLYSTGRKAAVSSIPSPPATSDPIESKTAAPAIGLRDLEQAYACLAVKLGLLASSIQETLSFLQDTAPSFVRAFTRDLNVVLASLASSPFPAKRKHGFSSFSGRSSPSGPPSSSPSISDASGKIGKTAAEIRRSRAEAEVAMSAIKCLGVLLHCPLYYSVFSGQSLCLN